ncbi:MAG: hypothetical protein ACOC33_03210 [bacterium]
MQKMEDIENIFEFQTTNYDQKKKLNRSDKTVPTAILEQIESGITLEDLNGIAKKYPIFKYGTQITIHGQFPKLNNNYIFGYKNVFQNKNKSIGIKYTAIDESKRKQIAERLYTIGFRYHRNSSEAYYYIQGQYTPEKLAEFQSIVVKIDKSLFYGNCNIMAGLIFGIKCIAIVLHVNAIPTENIEKFVNNLGATQEKLDAFNVEQQRKDAERKLYWENIKKEQEAKRLAAKENHQEDLDYLKANFQVIKSKDKTGIYILPKFDYNDNLKFVVFYAYFASNRARKLTVSERSFDSLKEALAHRPEKSYSDRKTTFVKGYYIKDI